MPRWIVVLIALLGWGLEARAGIYQTIDPDPFPLPPTHKQYFDRLNDVRDVTRLQKLIEPLKQKQATGLLTLEDRINLGALNLRLGDFPAALSVLLEAERDAPEDFMVLGNLATAYQGMGDFFRAQAKLQQGLKHWPREHPRFSQEQLFWYWRVETFQLDWIKASYRDQVRGVQETTDPLAGMFPGVKLYEPRRRLVVGDMTDANREAMPPAALAVVKQMMLWRPRDPDLFWSLALMLNAHGHVYQAQAIIARLRGLEWRYSREGINEVSRALREGAEELAAFKPEVQQQLFYALQWRSWPGAGPGGAALQGGSGLAILNPVDVPVQKLDLTPAQPQTDPQDQTTAPARFEGWQGAAVAFGAGLIIGALLIFQVGQIRRRLSAGGGSPTPAPTH